MVPMDRKQLLAQLEEALREPPGSIEETDQLKDFAGWDSIGALSVIALVDENYGIALEVDKMWACKTVADLIAIVEKG
jgi:acyl carrier protein